MGNLGTLMFGEGHYTKLFPEGKSGGWSPAVSLCVYAVVVCLLGSMLVSGLVHRVSATTWCVTVLLVIVHSVRLLCSLIFSLGALYFINKISSGTYTSKGSGVKYTSGKGKSQR